MTEAVEWELSALNELQRELRHKLGPSIVQPVRMQRREIAGAGVINVI